jgi:tripartite-type tricarboxylate transporter receptor subunit TctC
MRRSRIAVCMCCAVTMTLFAVSASAQNFPTKPIRIVTGAAGGGTDFVARLVAQGMSSNLGQPAIVDNRVSGITQGEIAIRAPADGYTLLVSSGNMWIAGFMQTVPYDAVKDFAPITLVATSPYLLLVNPGLPAKSVKELVALAKSSPGTLNYASNAVGSTNHLAGELFNSMAGINVTRVGYKSAAVGTTDLIGGRVQMMFSTVTTAGPHARSGKLRALAVTGAQSSALFPDLPTVNATVPGYLTEATYGLFTAAKTPPDIVSRLNQAAVSYVKSAEAREKMLNAGIEGGGNTPKEFADYMRLDMAKWGKLIKEAGIRAE